MGLLSPALLAALSRDRDGGFMLMDVDLTNGGQYPTLGLRRMSKRGVTSESIGHYEQRVKQFGTSRRSRADAQKMFRSFEVEVVVEDQDFLISNALASGADLRGCAVTRYVAHQDRSVTPADWFTEFAGQLYSLKQTGDLEYTMLCRPDDRPLTRKLPRIFFAADEFPKIHTDVEGKVAPLVYGLFDSQGVTNNGALPTYYIDTTNFRLAVAYGPVKVLRAYQDGVLKTEGTHYTIDTTTADTVSAGGNWTIIKWLTDPGTTVITVDAMGYGSQSGADVSIFKLTDLVLHLLANFGYEDGGKLGTNAQWYANTKAPIDQTLWDAASDALYAGAPFTGSLYINELTTAKDILAAWAESVQHVDIFWTNQGKLGVRVDDPCTSALTGLATHFRYPNQVKTARLVEPGEDDVVSRVAGQFAYMPSEGVPKRRLNVNEARRTGQGTETLETAFAQGWY